MEKHQRLNSTDVLPFVNDNKIADEVDDEADDALSWDESVNKSS